MRASGRYGDARGMLDSTGRSLRAPHTLVDYSGAIREGDRARTYAVGSALGAGAALCATAVVGWLSWKETGEVGIFRF